MTLNTVIENLSDEQNICGVKNNNIKLIEEIYNVKILIKEGNIIVSGEANDKLERLFSTLLVISNLGYTIGERDVTYISKLVEAGKENEVKALYDKPNIIGRKLNGKPIMPKTLNQAIYCQNLVNKDIIFGIGPAGTGKTYLAIAYAVSLMKSNVVKKIILTRPAVEAGESLGYLPGDLREKISPYLRPLYDALYDNLDYEQTQSLIEREIIEIAPLAYMRGRTLENACVILDEAQNTTPKQMKMFLTRLGFNAKMIITGDISQTDLPHSMTSGLKMVANLLEGINEIGIVNLSNEDVVRHPLVAKILDRYEKLENKE